MEGFVGHWWYRAAPRRGDLSVTPHGSVCVGGGLGAAADVRACETAPRAETRAAVQCLRRTPHALRYDRCLVGR